jgi:hypothetical protein
MITEQQMHAALQPLMMPPMANVDLTMQPLKQITLNTISQLPNNLDMERSCTASRGQST